MKKETYFEILTLILVIVGIAVIARLNALTVQVDYLSRKIVQLEARAYELEASYRRRNY